MKPATQMGTISVSHYKRTTYKYITNPALRLAELLLVCLFDLGET